MAIGDDYSKKDIITGSFNYVWMVHEKDSQEEQFELLVELCKGYPAFKAPEGQTGKMSLTKEDAIELAVVVATSQLDKKPSDEECYQMALPLLKKYYPQYFEEAKQKPTEEEKIKKGSNWMDKYTRQKVENVLQRISTDDPEKAFILAVRRLKAQYPGEWPTPKEMPKVTFVQDTDMRLEKEQAIELGKIVATYHDDPKPSEEEAYQKALPFLKKIYPHYFERSTQKMNETHKEALKEITVLDSCSLCGLCDQEELSDVFTHDENGKLLVRHGGVIDVEKYPKVLEVAELCPEKAIQIGGVKELSQEDASKVLDQFNRLVNKELRDYPFKVPNYQDDYAYETETYQALPVPAKYRSEAKYRTYEGAEDAGLSEFVRAVYSQAKNIKKQYIVAYKVKKLEKYYTYEETDDNFYYHLNKDVSQLLEKAVQLANVISKKQIKFPDGFEVFNVKPDWEKTEYSRQILQKFEDVDIDIESSTYFELSDWYRTYVNVDGYDRYFYDFTEAEKTFREYIDSAIWDKIDQYVPQWVEGITKEYLDRAKAELSNRINFLQTEVKKFVKSDDKDAFKTSIKKVCDTILQTALPDISVPSPNFDIDYDSSYRFRSESSCESAAERRRERAYNDGRSFLERLPRLFNEPYMEAFSKTMTGWKRELLSAFDINGVAYPNLALKVKIGKGVIEISLSNHDDVAVSPDSSIRDYFEQNLSSSACCGSVNGVSYMREYDCEINTFEDFDVKETIFGGIKEVNHRYSYSVNLFEFRYSAGKVANACDDVLKNSDFMKKYFSDIKKSFVSEIHRITGV